MIRTALLAVSAAFMCFGVNAGAETDPSEIDADLQARIAQAHAELGPQAPVRVVRGVYLLIAPNRIGFDSYVSVVERALAAYTNQRFAKLPARPVSVYLFSDPGSYRNYCRKQLGHDCISIYGFYQPDRRALIMNAGSGIGTVTHELVHPIVEADFPDAPTWLNEGIASLYEAPVFGREGEVRGAKNWRYRRLAAALSSRAEVAEARLDKMFSTSDDVFRGDKEDLNYATARYVCQWLEERKWLWPFYQRFRDHAAEDPTGRESFRVVTGMTPEEATTQWLAWARRL